jgi:hypothetical protein
MNSKVDSPEDAIWLMALPPAPPTPIILITVSGWGFFDSDKEDSVLKLRSDGREVPPRELASAEPIRLLAEARTRKVVNVSFRKHL